jgi:hypothetical protein
LNIIEDVINDAKERTLLLNFGGTKQTHEIDEGTL